MYWYHHPVSNMFVFPIIPTAILLLSSWGSSAILAPRSLSRKGTSGRSSSFHISYDNHNEFSRDSSSLLLVMMMREESSAKKPRASSSSSGRSTNGGRGFADSLPKLPNKSFSYSGTIRPGKQSPQRIVTDPTIMLPDYATDGNPKKHSQSPFPWMIEVKSPKEIERMREAGRCAREVLDIAGRAVQPGVTTDEIDALVHEETLKRGAYPSPLNYHGFPKSCCTSVNEIICHGIPDDRKLIEGDILNLDVTCYLNGYHGDCSEMFVVGEDTDEKSKELIQVTYDCWIKSMNIIKPGRDYKDIGGVIEDYVTERGFTTIKSFCGHGIGSVFHTAPNILHYKNNEPNGQMAPGHTFTVEPMICVGEAKCLTWPDQWTAATQDGKRTAQFEHTLLVTDTGVEPLTGKLPSSPIQFWERESNIHQGIWLGTSTHVR